MIGDENLHFTRLSDTTKDLVTDLVHTGVHTKVIVRGNYVIHFLADGYLAKMCA